jgi:glycosyltransferase involved in cell wall biosynthesis
VADERAALGERLELRGQVSHTQALALLADAEIAAVPSMWDDPCPRAAIEALAAGCALIATRRGGLAEIAEGAGLMVDPADTADFSQALRRLGRDAALRQSLQAAGLRRARESFDIVRATEKLDAARARAFRLA